MYHNSSYKVLLCELIPHQNKSPGPFTICVASAFQKEKSPFVLHSNILQEWQCWWSGSREKFMCGNYYIQSQAVV